MLSSCVVLVVVVLVGRVLLWCSVCVRFCLLSYFLVMWVKVSVKWFMFLMVSVVLVVIVWLLNLVSSLGLCLVMRFRVLCRWKLGMEWFEFLSWLLVLWVKMKVGWCM